MSKTSGYKDVSYENLHGTEIKVEAGPLVGHHTLVILKKIKGCLSPRRRITGYTFKFNLIIHRTLMSIIFRLIRDYRTPNNKPLQYSNCKIDTTPNRKSYTITFTSLYAFKVNFKGLLGDQQISQFVKKTSGSFTSRLTISLEKPLGFFYKESTNSLKVSGHYEIYSRINGEVISV